MENTYIVLLKPDVNKTAYPRWLRSRLSTDSRIMYDYSILNAFAAHLDDQRLEIVRASQGMLRIESAVADHAGL
ncbi:uncharacterized protein PHACADRAFT_250528 [Phanerochaete carnosa HHB-10118-sp]|uniref:Inhibitor I9 domain-containing protein n=1 Tax=Phanerochaete carnosa (strain HHB-10118-sp) TaxID=650164 RepID=K5WKX8_PHACS|nr:uncharacterized protein PHACADRAFT_250528 [Phanerochaete carnosa HHB-10118-sp]EKM59794.1 hypothetical protein PHACADRAFT_250528 [Phanerochaete carnosa HHB-10118-sp]